MTYDATIDLDVILHDIREWHAGHRPPRPTTAIEWVELLHRLATELTHRDELLDQAHQAIQARVHLEELRNEATADPLVIELDLRPLRDQLGALLRDALDIDEDGFLTKLDPLDLDVVDELDALDALDELGLGAHPIPVEELDTDLQQVRRVLVLAGTIDEARRQAHRWPPGTADAMTIHHASTTPLTDYRNGLFVLPDLDTPARWDGDELPIDSTLIEVLDRLTKLGATEVEPR